ncbi:MAG: hypothetical protein IT165_19795 [Bryobacterales bacterium]|nr:hypothetical protein [Bryobacterales bacterium]
MFRAACLTFLLALPLPAQNSASAPPPAESKGKTPAARPDDFKVYTEHPRLLANARHLRLLRRERERKSMRWEAFQAVMTANADLPEKGFAFALYYLVSQEPSYGRKAIEWALGPGRDLHQLALVFDWCQPLLTESQSKALTEKMVQAMEQESQKDTVPAVRDRVLAAITLFDHVPDLPEKTLRSFFDQWWVGKMAPALQKNRNALPRDDAYALLEIMHAVRDNLLFDIRDNALLYFRDFAVHRVLSYYPAVYPAPENMYRIPMYSGLGEPDLREAALSRAADLSLVAFDANALQNQFLQGWLIQDRFLMRGAYGVPYEFFWANPYQPGLSYHHLPDFFHDPNSGILLLRSNWEDDAAWLSYNNGDMELFLDGKRSGLQPRAIKEPLQIGDHIVMVGESPMRFTLNLGAKTQYFLIGLKPETPYDLEVDDEELREVKTDAGGILALSFPQSLNVSVRLKEYHAQ